MRALLSTVPTITALIVAAAIIIGTAELVAALEAIR